jgi:putative nucleotidyltransferase with HDIG domain
MMKLTQTSFRLRQLFSGSATIRWTILVVTAALFVLLLYPSLLVKRTTYQLGDVAEKDVKAPRDYLIEDKFATEKSRQKALGQVLTVYDHDTTLAARITERVQRAFSQMSSVIAENTNPDDIIVREGWEYVEGIERSENIDVAQKVWDLKDSFVKTLAIPVSDGAYRILEEAGFSAEIPDTIVTVLEEIMARGVVAPKEVFLRDLETGVIIRNVDSKLETRADDLQQFYGLDQAKAMVRTVAAPLLNQASYSLRNLVIDFIQALVQPNITLNTSETAERRKQALKEVRPVFYQVKTGEMIVREGERITPEQVFKLEAIKDQNRSRELLFSALGAVALVFALMLTIHTLTTLEKHPPAQLNKDLFCLALLFVLTLTIAKFFPALSETLADGIALKVNTTSLCYGIPLAAGAMTVCLLWDLRTAVAFGVITALAGALLFNNRLELFVYFLISTTVGAYWIRECRERGVYIKAGLKIGLVNVALATAIGIYLNRIDGLLLLWDWLLAFGGGIASGIVSAGLVPFFETAFGYKTDITLMELANLDRPILRRLMLEAPGTYHHSVIVGSLAEAAAAEIGANPILARVSGYYHDIGKINKPLYFIENQGRQNKHDKLAPAMSKRILVSHVKDGVEIAKKHKLGPEITDAILQHHGNSVIRYFFHKAIEQKGKTVVDIDDYRYPGPRPQSREAALIMLADVVEAASRTLENPTPSRIQGLVQDLINKVFSDGQLDNSDLTLKDLHNIANSFIKILNGIHHHRIDYPEKQTAANGSPQRNNGHSSRQPTTAPSHRSASDSTNRPSRLRRLGVQ